MRTTSAARPLLFGPRIVTAMVLCATCTAAQEQPDPRRTPVRELVYPATEFLAGLYDCVSDARSSDGVLSVPFRTIFEPGTGLFTAEGKVLLRDLTVFMRWGRYDLDLEGHADRDPGAHGEALERVSAIAHGLFELGVDPKRIRMISAGSAFPVAVDHNDWQRRFWNDRLEIHFRESGLARTDIAKLGSITVEARARAIYSADFFLHVYLKFHNEAAARKYAVVSCALLSGKDRFELTLNARPGYWSFDGEDQEGGHVIECDTWDGEIHAESTTRVYLGWQDGRDGRLPAHDLEGALILELRFKDVESKEQVTIITPPAVLAVPF